MQHHHYGQAGSIYASQRMQQQQQPGGSNPYSSMQFGHHTMPQQYGSSQYAPSQQPPPQHLQQPQLQQQQSWYQSASQRSVEPTTAAASRYAGYSSQGTSARAYSSSGSAQPANYSQLGAQQQQPYQSYTSQLASGMSDIRTSEMSVTRGSQQDIHDGRASASSVASSSQMQPQQLQPESMSRSSAPMQPQSTQHAGNEHEKARYRAKIDELQGIADRQAADLRRRNEELLDLQRNHEAFREKFILFREGMRSKTDESDARFRKLEAELKLNQEQLASLHAHHQQHIRPAERALSVPQLRALEEEAESLRREKGQLSEQLQAKDSGANNFRMQVCVCVCACA